MKSKQAHFVPGHRVAGRYELLYPFAQGGMAEVWIAQAQGPNGPERLVAVKTILPELAADKAFRAMFLDEARIATRIQHPNVTLVLDSGEDQGAPYMVFEWVSGDSWSKLHAALQKGGQAFPVEALVRIAADACAGLHAAHELRDEAGRSLDVVHRDVSPQNILLTNTGITKVIDFGIAKAVGRMAPKTRAGLAKGKLLYAAPEQLRMANVDRRADVWAIGTILYHYLSGKLPYERETDMATLENLLSGRPPPPLPPSVPPALAQVVTTALAPTPEGRFPTALDMARALEASLPRPATTAEVGALMQRWLADRIEMRRRDLAEALAEVEALRAAQPVGAPVGVGTPVGAGTPVGMGTAVMATTVAPRRSWGWVIALIGVVVVIGVGVAVTLVLRGR